MERPQTVADVRRMLRGEVEQQNQPPTSVTFIPAPMAGTKGEDVSQFDGLGLTPEQEAALVAAGYDRAQLTAAVNAAGDRALPGVEGINRDTVRALRKLFTEGNG